MLKAGLNTYTRVFWIVLDSVGIGELPDAADYGDVGRNTLGHIAESRPLQIPNLVKLGLANIAPLKFQAPAADPHGAYGKGATRSCGKDTTTGHWEMAGVRLEQAFPVYKDGFPRELIEEFEKQIGRRTIGNKPASGTEIIKELGEEHVRSGKPIVYTSGDSVFQIAAHEEVIPITDLYRMCAIARRLLDGPHRVGRVIARPFVGSAGDYRRSAQRRDFSLEPVGTTLLDRLADAGIPRVGIGKVDDLFAARNITSEHTPTNADAYRLIEGALDDLDTGFVFVNVIEFDQTWGHRNDVAGFHQGLNELDAWLPRLIDRLRSDDLVILTADHGNDPTTPSTDHSREVVPVLALGPRVKPVALGVRRTFADLGQTVAEYFGVPKLAAGTSFLGEVWA